MIHAVLILAHKNPEMLIPLVGYFKRDCMVYIHFDAACPFPASVQSALQGYPQVKGIYQQYRVHWGGFSVLEAELFLLRKALSDSQADFYHLISGQDYPIKPLHAFLSFFENHPEQDYIDYQEMNPESNHFDVLRRLYLFQPHDRVDARTRQGRNIALAWSHHQLKNGFRKRHPTQFSRFYKASQWFSVTDTSARLLSAYTSESPAFLDYLRYEFAPEECYVPTVIINLSPVPHHNCNYRYIRWKSEHGSNPSNLGMEHFEDIRQSDAFFARKMEKPYCVPLIQHIDQQLLHE